MSLPAIDKAFAERILSIKPEMIHFALVDLIEKKDRDALINRLQGVQTVIRRQMKKEDRHRKSNPSFTGKFLSKPDEWKKLLDEERQKLKEATIRLAKPQARILLR